MPKGKRKRPGAAQSRREATDAGVLGLSSLCKSLQDEIQVVTQLAEELCVGRIKSALDALEGVAPAPPGQDLVAPSEPGGKRKRRRRSGGATTTAEVNERREAVYRFLLELGRWAANGEIRAALNLTSRMVNTALRQLCKEGRVRRIGTGSATRYEAISTDRAAQKPTLQGRIVATVEERGWASASELAQVTGVSVEVIEQECGALIMEKVVRMERHDGRPVYVIVVRR